MNEKGSGTTDSPGTPAAPEMPLTSDEFQLSWFHRLLDRPMLPVVVLLGALTLTGIITQMDRSPSLSAVAATTLIDPDVFQTETGAETPQAETVATLQLDSAASSATASPTPTPHPTATPVARSTALPVIADPTATPIPTSTSTPTSTAVPTSTATPVPATPIPTSTATPVPATPVPATPTPATPLPPSPTPAPPSPTAAPPTSTPVPVPPTATAVVIPATATPVSLPATATALPAPGSVGVGSFAAISTTQAEANFVSGINQYRAQLGLQALTVDPAMSDVARRWSEQMSLTGGIPHNPNLRNELPAGWQNFGENVGSGNGDWLELHQAFLASPGHEANIRLSSGNRIGLGVVYANGKQWVTQIFATY